MLTIANLELEVLAGNKDIIRRHDDIFSNISLLFLEDLSKLLLINNKENYSDIAALSFWLRKRNINKYLNQYVDHKKRVGLGIVFHITPSNIPTNFAYSFIYGLISGNSNIIRISEKKNAQVDVILNTIKKLFEKNIYKELKYSNSFIKYGHNDKINNYLSANCDARIIWGGNITINKLKKFSLKLRSRELVFPDRYSISILDESFIESLGSDELDRLIQKFYNDTYLVDQNACSSPRLIVWINCNGKGKKLFWEKLALRLNTYKLNNSMSFEKYTILCEIMSKYGLKLQEDLNKGKLYTLTIQKLDNLSFLSSIKLGIFIEYNANTIDEIFQIDSSSLQTLSYAGIKKDKLMESFSKHKTRSFDRIVPIGSTLDMDMNWDGFSIPHTLSRVIDFK